MRLPTFYEQNLIPNWGNILTDFSRFNIAVIFFKFIENQVIPFH